MTEDLPVPRTVFQVPVRDGITLATDVYGIPDDDRALPVVLERTPYGRRSIRTSDAVALNTPVPLPKATATRFVNSGFIVVRQDCRGRGDSEGEFEKYVDESNDGEDTLEWIAAQPWSDGRVGMMGVSYSAHVQTAVAARGPASLMAMVLDSGGFNSAFEAGVRYGGAFELKQATWAVRHARKSAERRSEQQRAELETVDVKAWFERMPTDPWRPGHSPLTAAPEYESYLFDQWRRDVLDDGWRSESVYTRDSGEHFSKAPTLAIGSWYDPYVRSVVELYHRQSSKDAHACLVMGPWLHGMRAQTHSGDIEFGSIAAWEGAFGEDYTHSRIEWMHEAAEGTHVDKPAVTAFVMGGGSGRKDSAGRLLHGGRWHQWSAWPPAESDHVSLALGADGAVTRVAEAKGSIDLTADPADPVPTLGGQITSGAPVMTGGGFDQTEVGGRDDVLVFRTAPLNDAVTVAGRVRLHIVLVASTPDLDVSVKLIDEYPPSQEWPHGFALNVCDGILRARYRRGYERKVPLDIGVETELVVDLPDTANLFAAGHIIRVDIAGSNFPHFDINPNHGGPPWELPHLLACSKVILDGRTRLEIDTVPCPDRLPEGSPLNDESSAGYFETSAS